MMIPTWPYAVVMDIDAIVDIDIGQETWDRCRAYAERCINAYLADRKPRSRQVGIVPVSDEERAKLHNPGVLDISSNIRVQTLGKAGECAACQALGIPLSMLNWSDVPDPGVDLSYRGLKVDVKTTGRSVLLWAKGKNSFLQQRPFDAFLLVCHRSGRFDVVGWIGRKEFIAEHLTASHHPYLIDGTWYMEPIQLRPLSTWGQYAR